MRAALLPETFRIEMADVEVPRPGHGDVLIRVGACAICGSDLNAYRGVHPNCRPPTILGHEFAGTIAELGPEVEGIAVGDRVCAEPNLSCGHCVYCKAGRTNICLNYKVVGDHFDGAIAEYVKVPARNVHRLPDNVSFEAGALVQPLAISYHSIDRAGVEAGDLVVVLGAGPIGLGAMLAARARGARVMITDTLDYRLELASGLGAEFVVNVEREDLVARVRAETDGLGADRVIEAVGGKQDATIQQATQVVRRGGVVAVMGSFGLPTVPLRITEFKYGELDLRGSQGHPGTFSPMIDLIASGKLDVKPLITHVMPIEETANALKLLETRGERVFKVVLRP